MAVERAYLFARRSVPQADAAIIHRGQHALAVGAEGDRPDSLKRYHEGEKLLPRPRVPETGAGGIIRPGQHARAVRTEGDGNDAAAALEDPKLFPRRGIPQIGRAHV